jgi:hypothetical protein
MTSPLLYQCLCAERAQVPRGFHAIISLAPGIAIVFYYGASGCHEGGHYTENHSPRNIFSKKDSIFFVMFFLLI